VHRQLRASRAGFDVQQLQMGNVKPQNMEPPDHQVHIEKEGCKKKNLDSVTLCSNLVRFTGENFEA
jgi:hypothetical protein